MFILSYLTPFDLKLGSDFDNLMHVKDVAQCFDEEDPTHDNDEDFIGEVHGVVSDDIKPNANIDTP